MNARTRPISALLRTAPIASALLCSTALASNARPAGPDLPARNPDAIVDLTTAAGQALVRSHWRSAPARIVETDFRAAGPDMKPSGPPNRTHDVQPRAGARGFDDSAWEVVGPGGLEARRGDGRLSMVWYRTTITVPEQVASFETTGSTAVLELVVDDYAEVWIDGAMPLVIGQGDGPTASGWNTPVRVIAGKDLRPGRQIEIAVLAMNGPVSDPPANYVWIRSATLDFYRPERLSRAEVVPLRVDRLDPVMDRLVPPGAVLEKVASGFGFTEGPVWVPAAVGGAGAQPIATGYLLFSDPNNNTIYRWSDDSGVSVFRPKSGYTGPDIALYRQPGSNGLALDSQGRLTICEHGNRRVTRIEKNGHVTVLADSYRGGRLNSPNDLVYRSDGALLFTDPPFGLPAFHDDPRRELAHFGVYALVGDELKLLSTALTGPNGLALSPDERTLYVANWDESRKVILAYDLSAAGVATGERVVFDMTTAPGEEALDGLKVDELGNLYCSGPGGVWVISSDGRHLGTINGPELPANFAWGGEDGRTLYLTARTGVYRLAMGVGTGAKARPLASR